MTKKHKFLIFLGPPGSGKGTQSHILQIASNHLIHQTQKYNDIYNLHCSIPNSNQTLNQHPSHPSPHSSQGKHSKYPIYKIHNTSSSSDESIEEEENIPRNAFEQVFNLRKDFLNANRKHFVSISAGDVLRSEAQRNDTLKNLLSTGQFAPEELTRSLMENNVRQVISHYQHESEHLCLILDGYPRTPFQLEYILEHWKQYLNMRHDNTRIFEILASKEIVVDRLKGRYIHRESGRTYHKDYNPPIFDFRDDLTGESLSRRDDDSSVEVILRRYENYNNVSRPMLKVLQDDGFKIETVPEMNIYDTHLYISNIIEQL